ncbi:MAG: DNA-binding protein [Candidatus Muproteobacteria bacterium RBG_16_65_34]|uniref:DNA-binding protein n=1 Tax=Candidatus Muproteobacteria bacterium RBG_16_65_34 TaxID=1817760 RepID=A0A1F6TMW9_9PROT|nr:MAG: DNA-binding protein [Candidatus Muproteobacteria bacterium RBG_16_65_34]
MAEVLVDSNVILDILTEDRKWFRWSAEKLETLSEDHVLLIDPIVYSEVSVGFDRIEDLDAALPPAFFRRDPLPWEAGFLAGKCFLKYRNAGGARRSPLPDFYIGAHAAIRGIPLLTRDARRYRHYFPRLTLISP